MLDFETTRARFPTLEKLVYLNSGSYGLLADTVQSAMLDYLQSRLELGADWDAWVERSERVRSKTARLLNVGANEIAVTASASAGMNSVASALRFGNGRDRIVISNYEFPTSGQIWHAQEPRGAVLHHVAEDEEGIIPLDHFERAIDERTRLVVISHVCYRHGGKLPADDIRALAELAHRNGAYLMLDCYQSVGSEPIDLKQLDVDFAAGGMLKYLLGTAGIGFLYVRRDLVRDLTPTVSGWFAQENIGAMDIFANVPSNTASRYQAGTPPVPSCYGADAGLDIILEYGCAAIGARVRDITSYALDRFQGAGFQVATPKAETHRGPMIALRAKDDARLVQELRARGIVTSSRDGNLRAGFHFYNNRDDVDRTVDALEACRPLLA